MTNPDFNDLDAVRQIATVLEPFDGAARQRILRWVAERAGIHVEPVERAPKPPASAAALSPDERRDIRATLDRALATSDFESLRSIQAYLQQAGMTGLLHNTSMFLASAGQTAGQEVLLAALRNGEIPDDELQHAVGALVQYYHLRDEERQGIQDIGQYAIDLARRDASASDRAFVLNQLGRLHYGAGQIEQARVFQEEAAELVPDEAAYQYNLSIIAEKQGRLDDARRCIERMLTLGTHDPDHLQQAVEVFQKIGDKKRGHEIEKQLREISPARAASLKRSEG